MLVSLAGKPVRFFSGSLDEHQAASLNPRTATTIYFECEFLAVPVAYRAWAKEVAGSQLVAVRDCLISCDTSNEIASIILRES